MQALRGRVSAANQRAGAPTASQHPCTTPHLARAHGLSPFCHRSCVVRAASRGRSKYKLQLVFWQLSKKYGKFFPLQKFLKMEES